GVQRATEPAREVGAHGQQREREAERGARDPHQRREEQAVDERRGVRPAAEQAAHGVEARPSVPEGQQEQGAQRVENEQGHRPPDQHDGRGGDRIAPHSLITSFTQRSTSRLRLLPTQSRSTGSSLASFMIFFFKQKTAYEVST